MWERGTASLSVVLHDFPRAVLSTRGGNAAKGSECDTGLVVSSHDVQAERGHSE